MLTQITIFDTPVEFGVSFFAMMSIVFLAGMIRGFTGFGSALLTVPALTVLYGPAQAIVIEILIEIPVSLGLLKVAVKESDRRTILPMLLMFAIFVPVGTVLLTVTNPSYVKIVIAVFVLVSVCVIAQQTRLAQVLSPKTDYIIGAISGTTQGLTGMAGPLFATALVAKNDPAARTRANISALATGIIVMSVISFGAFGLITIPTLVYAALATPAILCGVWVGAIVFRSRPTVNFRAVVLAFLTIIALYTLYDALA